MNKRRRYKAKARRAYWKQVNDILGWGDARWNEYDANP